MFNRIKNKTWILLLSLTLLFVLSACSKTASNEAESSQKEDEAKTLQIGYQKYGTLNFVRAKGTLEKELQPLGVTVEWTEFPGGPQLLEALNVGSIDFGHTGEAPPIFAQAADAPLIYYANGTLNPKGEAIVVPEDSPIKTVEDLRGKKIALNKGSNVHYLLVKVLEKHGISYDEVETAFLPPSDARAAFEKGSVDAWVIWDPFLAEAEKKAGARILVDGTDVVHNREFYLASEEYAKAQPEVLDIIVKEIEKTETWIQENQKEAAEHLAPQIGMDQETLEVVLDRKTYGIEKITDQVINDQQQIADKFYDLKLIPQKIKTSEAVLK